jgi:nucleoside-diphosphate-sugar epimerase
MRILVTGASGGLGRFLVQRLIDEDRSGASRFEQVTLLARNTGQLPTGPRIRVVAGDIRDREARRKALEGGVDVAYHFAASLAALAEKDFDDGWSINVDASLALLNELRDGKKPVRVVYPSSIGVYGAATAHPVNDDTLPRPTIAYGTAKFINELVINELSRRGEIDGISLRLPLCLPRPRQPDLDPSPDFASSVFYALPRGEAFRMPVSPNASIWFMSVPCLLDNVLHAARLPSDKIANARALMIPAQRFSLGQIVEAIIAEAGPIAKDRVTWNHIPGLEEIFAVFPPLSTPLADSLGFRHDGDAATMVKRTLTTIANAP